MSSSWADRAQFLVAYIKNILYMIIGILQPIRLVIKSTVSTIYCLRNTRKLLNFRSIFHQFYFLIKESLLVILFLWGPYTLAGVTFFAAFLIYLCCKILPKLGAKEEYATSLGLDLAAVFTRTVYKVWHGLEFKGLENIPVSGGALIVWYHGPMPADYFGLVAEIQFQYGRRLKSIVDRCLRRIPYSSFLMEKLGCTTEGREYLVSALQRGELFGVAPGGSREALFGEDYSVKWGTRTGFAKVALEAQAPIIPVFTENIREAYSTMMSLRTVWRYIFETTRLPIIPVWGGFPVKLVCHVGEPIYPTEGETPEHLKQRTKDAIEGLMEEHQSKNMDVTRGIVRRFKAKPEKEDFVTINV